jgi:hypothetical protein
MLTLLAILVAGLAMWLAGGLVSYAIFHPYVDTLWQKVTLNAVAYPSVLALMVPAIRGEGAEMIPVYFVGSAVSLGTAAAVLHFAERRLRFR